MSLRCTKCQSNNIDVFKPSTKYSSAIGAIGGASQAIHAFHKGAEIGAKSGADIGVWGMVGGTVIGGITGAFIGCMAGKKLGELIDENVTGHALCNDCGHSFPLKPESNY